MRNTGFLNEDDIDDVLLDSWDEKSIDILVTLTSKNLKVKRNLATTIIMLYKQEKYYAILLVNI